MVKIYWCIIQHLIRCRLLPSVWCTDISASESLTSFAVMVFIVLVSLGAFDVVSLNCPFFYPLYQMMKHQNNLRTPSDTMLIALWVRRQFFADGTATSPWFCLFLFSFFGYLWSSALIARITIWSAHEPMMISYYIWNYRQIYSWRKSSGFLRHIKCIRIILKSDPVDVVAVQ